MQDVEARIEAIRLDREHGSAWLTAESLMLLGEIAAEMDAEEGWVEQLESLAGRIAGAKPVMAGLGNGVERLASELMGLGPDEGKWSARWVAQEHVLTLREASEGAARRAAGLVKVGAVVATCSYSSAITRLCKHAVEARKQPRIVVLETNLEPAAYGRRLAVELGERGVSTEVVDAAGMAAAGGIQAGFIGADAVTTKYVVNGAPSLELAKAAQGRFPMYAVCESVKLIRDVPVEAGYEEVPLEMFAGVVTEGRLLTPADVRRLLVF